MKQVFFCFIAAFLLASCERKNVSQKKVLKEFTFEKLKKSWLENDSIYFNSWTKTFDTISNKHDYYGSLAMYCEITNFCFYYTDSTSFKYAYPFSKVNKRDISWNYNSMKALEVFQKSQLYFDHRISDSSIRYIRDKYWKYDNSEVLSDSIWNLVLADLNKLVNTAHAGTHKD